MTQKDQQQLGKTLWNIADDLRGAMNADDFRDYMLSFLFLRYLSYNYEEAAKKELVCNPVKLGSSSLLVKISYSVLIRKIGMIKNRQILTRIFIGMGD